jgi:hypothetical protein
VVSAAKSAPSPANPFRAGSERKARPEGRNRLRRSEKSEVKPRRLAMPPRRPAKQRLRRPTRRVRRWEPPARNKLKSGYAAFVSRSGVARHTLAGAGRWLRARRSGSRAGGAKGESLAIVAPRSDARWRGPRFFLPPMNGFDLARCRRRLSAVCLVRGVIRELVALATWIIGFVTASPMPVAGNMFRGSMRHRRRAIALRHSLAVMIAGAVVRDARGVVRGRPRLVDGRWAPRSVAPWLWSSSFLR